MRDSALLRVYLLDGFQVVVGEHTIDPAAWRQRRAAAIIKLLALEPSHQLRRDELMDRLWPDLDPDRAANNLRFALHHARRVIASGTHQAHLLRVADMILLGPAGQVWTDVTAFEDAAARAWHTEDPAAFRRAVDAYRGHLLPEDPDEEWIIGRRQALRSIYQSLLRRLAQLAAERRQVVEAIDALQRLLVVDTADESAHRELMCLFADTGQRHQALLQYRHLEAILAEELGVRPDSTTTALFERIRDRIDAASPVVTDAADGEELETSHQRIRNIPFVLQNAIGRACEIDEIGQLVQVHRLVTLTGPGGIGKTRLALATAHDVEDAFSGGVYLVHLTPISDPAHVLPAIARVLGVRPAQATTVFDALVAAIEEQRVLLVLDNVEHVAQAAPSVVALLEHCPDLTVLATSRMRLNVRGEREYPVAPLTLPDLDEVQVHMSLSNYGAIALFLERASEVVPGFRVTEDTAPAIVEICHRLDGLPLAIELAAAWCRVFSPDLLLAHLARPLDLLVDGPRDLPARQQTLRTTIAWSYDLLMPIEQRLFRRLAVFVGGWTLEAALVACQDEALPADVIVPTLGALVGKSLVITRATYGNQPADRFSLLSTIRAFGIEQLEAAGEAEAVRHRHADYLLSLTSAARGMLGADRDRWLDQMELELPNIRAALEWLIDTGQSVTSIELAAGLWRLWLLRGYLQEGRRWFERALASDDALPPASTATALQMAGDLASWQGEHTLAMPMLERSLVLFTTANDQWGQGRVLYCMSRTAAFCGDLDAAIRHGEASVDVFRTIDDQSQLANSLGSLGFIVEQRGNLPRAAVLMEEAIQIARRLDDGMQQVIWLANLGWVAWRMGESMRAIDLYRQSLETNRRIREMRFAVESLEGLAGILVDQEQAQHAVELFGIAIGIRERIGYPVMPMRRVQRDMWLTKLDVIAGQPALEQSVESGRNMPFDSIVELALTASRIVR